MLTMTTAYNTANNASKRIIKAKAELYLNSSLTATYTQNDAIKSINIDRVGDDSKFFGIGVAHKANIKLIDVKREIDLTTDNYFKIQLGIELNNGSIEYASFPKMYITEVNRDENTNELSITAYDVLNEAKTLTINDLELAKPYTIKNVLKAVGAKIGANKTITGKNQFNEEYARVIANYTLNSDIGSGWKALTIDLQPNTKYTITRFADNVACDGGYNYQFYLYEDTINPLFYINNHSKERILNDKTLTFTTGESGKLYLAHLYASTERLKTLFDNIDIQIEEETTATNYEPYLSVFDTEYTDGANFEGSENLKDVLTAAAEATQTIYFIDSNDNLVFKRLDKDGEAVKTISRANYITLDSSANRRLSTICHATELGDNVSAAKMEKSNKTINIDLGDNELCSIGNVKDELVVQNGNAKIIKKIGKIVLNGSEKWSGGQSGTASADYTYFHSNAIDGKVATGIFNAFCDKLSVLKDVMLIGTNVTTDTISCANYNGQSIRVMLLTSRLAAQSTEAFKTWLATNNITVYYVLATPEEIAFDISGYNLADGVYYGESKQEIRSGYNILPNNGTSTTINGITFTVNEDKSITMNGTATNNANFPIFGTGWNITDEQITLGTGTYFTIGTGTNNAIVYCRDGINNVNVATQLNNVQVTNQLALITYVYIQVPSGKTVSNETIYPMIVKGEYTKNTFPKYEQYGVSPSPDNPSEIGNKETIDANILYPITGTTQYVRDNPFWELREDIADLLEDAKNAICGITINQFDCKWRGDLALEIGDKIALVTKDNNTVISYLLNDAIEYNGGLSQTSEWQYSDDEDSESNPNNLGDAIKQTFAKVDKANKQIDLVVSEVDANKTAISSLKISTDAINASVQKDLNELTNKVNATMTAEDVRLEIQSELSNGVDKVTTKTGFTFDDEGLTVSKSGSEMTTKIDEDGMTVYRDNAEMLKANNEGVIAYNLHAKTYLIVGESSRFEDYEKDGETRTGCFWIGGA